MAYGAIACDRVQEREALRHALSGILPPGVIVLRVLRRRLYERHCSHQVVSERVPQHHRLHLVKPAYQKLTEPASACNGIDTFGSGGPLLVNFLGGFSAHTLAPLSQRFAVIGQRQIRITARVSRVTHRSIDRGATAVGIFNISVAGKATVGEPLGGTLLIALLDLLEHGESCPPSLPQLFTATPTTI